MKAASFLKEDFEFWRNFISDIEVRLLPNFGFTVSADAQELHLLLPVGSFCKF